MIKELVKNGNLFKSHVKSTDYGSYIDHPQFDDWKRKSLMFLQMNYPGHPQTVDFEKNIDDDTPYNLSKLVAILKAFDEIKQPLNQINYLEELENIFRNFFKISNQLRRRYDKRETIQINDEYDVQDLLHGLLHLYFNDIRNEDWVPEYAGGKSRVDFLLKNEGVVIETKYATERLTEKKLGDQLIIDIAHYKELADCKHIVCFIYDPDFNLSNPVGLKNDLEKLSDNNGVKVSIYIFPH